MTSINELGRRAAQLEAEGRFEEAEAVCRQVLRREPGNAAARYAMASLRLRQGDWTRGWELYEARRDLPGGRMREPRPSYPEWRGDPVRSLLVWYEQGLGDQIMFARWIPLLARQGIAVTLVCSPHLARLFRPLGAQVVPAEGSVSLPRHDAWCLIGSLPRLMGGLPAEPYLPSETEGTGRGVAVRGSPNHPGDAARSLFGADAERLLALGRSLLPDDTGARDMEDGRQIVAGLAEVIAVDTSLAHLAGAMGKPTTLLLSHCADWRWGTGEVTPWYPSMRIIRQQRPNDWGSVLNQLHVRP